MLVAMAAAKLTVDAVADALAVWPLLLAGGASFALLGAVMTRQI